MGQQHHEKEDNQWDGEDNEDDMEQQHLEAEEAEAMANQHLSRPTN
jgi:hypothetical protein